MLFKKIYLEITNSCNLKCKFCIRNNRKIEYISRDKYEYVINSIKGDTKEIYLHVLGEPLMHKDINYFIDYAYNNNLLVNITTNGYLIDRIENNKNIHRLNISLHSYSSIYNIPIDIYLDKIFNVIDKIKDKTFITLRLWVKDNNSDYIVNYINKRYHTDINNMDINKKIKVTNNLIIDTFHEFIWPDLKNDYYSDVGTCYGLRNHLGILVDGTIIPCCLDSKGIINLGNIYKDNIKDIMNSERVLKMIEGFRNNHKYEELCRHCHFLDNDNNL